MSELIISRSTSRPTGQKNKRNDASKAEHSLEETDSQPIKSSYASKAEHGLEETDSQQIKKLLNNISLDEKKNILSTIIKSLNNDETDEMKDILFEKKAITLDEKNAIVDGKIMEALVAHVQKCKSEREFNTFFKAYNETHAQAVENILSKNHLCQDGSKAEHGLEETDSQPIKSSCTSNTKNKNVVGEENKASQLIEKPYEWYLNQPELKHTPMTQADASQFHRCFGHNWQDLMLLLGFKMNTVELELENAGHRTQRVITNLIIKWIQREGRAATFGKFIDLLINYVEYGGTIDWPAVENVVMKKK